MNLKKLSLYLIVLLAGLHAHAVDSCQALLGLVIGEQAASIEQNMSQASNVSSRIFNAKYDIDQIMHRELKPEASRDKIDQAVNKIFDKLTPILNIKGITFERQKSSLVMTFPKDYIQDYKERARQLSVLHPINRLAYHLYHRFGVQLTFKPAELKFLNAAGLYDSDSKQIVTSLNSLLEAKIDSTLIHEVRHAYLSFLDKTAKMSDAGVVLMATEFKTGNPSEFRTAPFNEKLPVLIPSYEKYLRTDELMSHLGDLYSLVGPEFRQAARPMQKVAQEVLTAKMSIDEYKQKQAELGLSPGKRKLAAFLTFLGLQKILPQTNKLKVLLDATQEYAEIENLISENQEVFDKLKYEESRARQKSKSVFDSASSDYKWQALESLLYTQKTILDSFLTASAGSQSDQIFITDLGRVKNQAYFDSDNIGIRIQNDKYRLNFRGIEADGSIEVTGSVKLENQENSDYNGEKSFRFVIHSKEMLNQFMQTIVKLHAHKPVTDLFRERSYQQGVSLQEVSSYFNQHDIETLNQIVAVAEVNIKQLHQEIASSYELINTRKKLVEEGRYDEIASLISQLRQNFLKLYYPQPVRLNKI